MLIVAAIMTAALVCGLIGVLIYSIVRPENRVWPPPGQHTWQYVVVWLLTILAFAGFVVVGVLDWNSLGWPVLIRWPFGSVLIVAGNVLAWFGVRQLSLKTTSGSKGPLVTDGLYRYSRNPQYLGDIAIIAGWAILSASQWATPICLGGVFAFALTPIAEEPWLQEIHGDIYREYCEKVPRFFLATAARREGFAQRLQPTLSGRQARTGVRTGDWGVMRPIELRSVADDTDAGSRLVEVNHHAD